MNDEAVGALLDAPIHVGGDIINHCQNPKWTVSELTVWDRQTDKQTVGAKHNKTVLDS